MAAKKDPPADPADGQTAADLVNANPPPNRPFKSKRPTDEAGYQKRIATLEDENGSLKDRLAEVEKVIGASTKMPSTRKSGGTVWQDICEFMGWDEK